MRLEKRYINKDKIKIVRDREARCNGFHVYVEQISKFGNSKFGNLSAVNRFPNLVVYVSCKNYVEKYCMRFMTYVDSPSLV